MSELTNRKKVTQIRNSTIALVLIVTLLIPTTAMAGLGSKKIAYMGGTTKDKDFPNVRGNVEGRLNTGDERVLRFIPDKKKLSEHTIPYKQIIDIEYGQKAGRRIGAAVATTILVAPIGLVLLASKKRKHYVTIGFIDDNGQEQVTIFELGKSLIRTTLPILKARSGKEIIYQGEEAKKFAGVN